MYNKRIINTESPLNILYECAYKISPIRNMSERQKILVKFSLEIFPYLHLKGQENVQRIQSSEEQRGYRECT